MKAIKYQHPRWGFALLLPEDWERFEDTRGTALISLAPERPSFRANAVVTTEQLPPDLSLLDWHTQSLDLLQQHLHAFWLIDREIADLGARPVGHTVGHHTTDAGAITVEQWLWRDHPTSFTLTASANTLDYPDLRSLFAAIAGSFQAPAGG